MFRGRSLVPTHLPRAQPPPSPEFFGKPPFPFPPASAFFLCNPRIAVEVMLPSSFLLAAGPAISVPKLMRVPRVPGFFRYSSRPSLQGLYAAFRRRFFNMITPLLPCRAVHGWRAAYFFFLSDRASQLLCRALSRTLHCQRSFEAGFLISPRGGGTLRGPV